MINIVRKDFNLPLVFSPCLCEYLCPPESDQFCIAGRTKCAKSAQWTIYWTLTLSSRLPIWRILHISCCLWCRIGEIPRQRGGVSNLAPAKSGGLGDDLERYVDLSRGIWWILQISSCCAELVTFSAREERSDLLPVWCRGLGDDLDEDVDLSRGRDRTDGRPALTGLQGWPGHLTTWPPGHLTSWPGWHPIGRTPDPLAT